jgi:hypothetical protein
MKVWLALPVELLTLLTAHMSLRLVSPLMADVATWTRWLTNAVGGLVPPFFAIVMFI